MKAREIQDQLDEAQRALSSTRASLDARLGIALQAIAAVVVSRADRDVVDAAAELLQEPSLRAERVLVFVEPRRAALSSELADVDAVAVAAEANRLIDESAAAADSGDQWLLLSQAARARRLAGHRRAAEDGLRALDEEVLRYCHGTISAIFFGWLSTSPKRFDDVAHKLPSSARGVVRSARTLGAGRRYLDAVVARVLTPVVHANAARLLQQQVDASDDDVSAADVAACVSATAVVAAVADAIDGFRDYDAVSEDDVLWDLFFGDDVKSVLGDDADGNFVAEVKAARDEAAVDRTSVDVDSTLVLSSKPQPKEKQKKKAQPLTAIADDEGGRLGRYTLLKRLGSGGMAEVWLARQDGPRGFQKDVVVKRILDDHAGDPYFIGLFQKEASVIAGLQHPNLIHVFDLGVEGDRWFMAMELLRGKSLLELARGLQPFPVDVAARVCADAARGLAYAHQRPVVHRDISPDNLFVTESGLTKVIDFGVAKAGNDQTNNNALKGKVPYMAPEVFRGDPFDGAVDVFALGVTMWLVLVGKRPFQGSLGEIMRAIVAMTEAPRVSAQRAIPADLDDLVAAMMAPRAADRPTAMDVDNALTKLAAPLPTLTALIA